MSHLIAWLIVLPLLWALGSYLFVRHAKAIALLGALAWLSCALFFFFIESHGIYPLGDFLPPLGIVLQATPFGSLFVAMSSVIVTVVILYSVYFFNGEAFRLFYPLSGFLSAGTVVLFFARDLFTIYVALEVIGLSSVALAALESEHKSIKAALSYFFATLVASGLYLFGVALLYIRYGMLDIVLLQDVMQNDPITLGSWIFIAVAMALKTALFPFHYWLPSAHANALSPVSALLSALVIKTSFYLLYKVHFSLYEALGIRGEILGYLGVAALFYGGVQAFFAKEVKMLIAYSSISQVGYLFLVFAFANDFAHGALVLTILSHAFAKAGIFLSAGVVLLGLGVKELVQIRGALQLFPVSFFSIGLGAMSLIGLPPSLGFSAKFYYLQAAFSQERWFFFGAILLGGLLSAAYLFKLLLYGFEHQNVALTQKLQAKRKILEGCGFFLAFLSVFLGFWSGYILEKAGL